LLTSHRGKKEDWDHPQTKQTKGRKRIQGGLPQGDCSKKKTGRLGLEFETLWGGESSGSRHIWRSGHSKITNGEDLPDEKKNSQKPAGKQWGKSAEKRINQHEVERKPKREGRVSYKGTKHRPIHR